MSGIGAGHNKFETCAGCPDRCPIPNCHESCEGFLYRQRKREEQKAERQKESDYYDYKFERYEYMQKAARSGKYRDKWRRRSMKNE